MRSLMLLMSFAAQALSKLSGTPVHMINNNWRSGYVKGRLPKADSMVDLRNCLMCVTHGGFTQLYV